VQVCTAAMVYGFKIVQDLCDGLSNFMDQKGYANLEQMRGRAVGSITDWQQLNLNHVDKAVIHQDLCIQCGRCHVVCEDTSHQAISATKDGMRFFEVKEEECVGCNLCVSICPVPGALSMRTLKAGEMDARTGHPVVGHYANWTTHPNNPMRTGSHA
jgi:dihydropyrimidine dehydrogenase (NAD+) subunit PreA